MNYSIDFNNGGVSCNHKCTDFSPLHPLPDEPELERPFEDESNDGTEED